MEAKKKFVQEVVGTKNKTIDFMRLVGGNNIIYTVNNQSEPLI